MKLSPGGFLIDEPVDYRAEKNGFPVTGKPFFEDHTDDFTEDTRDRLYEPADKSYLCEKYFDKGCKQCVSANSAQLCLGVGILFALAFASLEVVNRWDRAYDTNYQKMCPNLLLLAVVLGAITMSVLFGGGCGADGLLGREKGEMRAGSYTLGEEEYRAALVWRSGEMENGGVLAVNIAVVGRGRGPSLC